MIKIWQAIVLGVAQGLTEFLPVSSSGHLVLLQKLMGLDGEMLYFDILMHAATLLAVIIIFRKDIWRLIKKPLSKESLLLVFSAIPTVAIVMLFKSAITDSFSGSYLGYGFLFTAVLLLVTDLAILRKKQRLALDRKIKLRSVLTMSIAQGFAVLPGISRSGSTICSGLIAGESRETAARFSFLMSIPIIIGSMIMSIIDIGKIPDAFNFDFLPLFFGFVFAFVFGLFAIKFMLKIIKNRRFWPFVVYLIPLALASFFLI